MSKERVNITETFGALLNKSMEANKVFVKEGTRIFQQMASKDKNMDKLNIFSLEGWNEVFGEYVDLNVRHFNNMVDLGLSFMKSVGNPGQETAPKEDEAEIEEPSFVLQGETVPGGIAAFRFLLDNSRPGPVQCELVSSGYVLQSDGSDHHFLTEFAPQAFALEKSESIPVSISIYVPDGIQPGLYISKVQVKGFEPAYFSVQLKVVEKHQETKVDAGKKTTRTKAK